MPISSDEQTKRTKAREAVLDRICALAPEAGADQLRDLADAYKAAVMPGAPG